MVDVKLTNFKDEMKKQIKKIKMAPLKPGPKPSPPRPKKEIKHSLKCENCGDPAEVNYQLVWMSWRIGSNGDYSGKEFHNIDEQEFWCYRCWNLDRNEKYDKLKEIREKSQK